MLVDYVLPWIQRLHIAYPVDLFPFWKRDSIGELHLLEEEDTTEFKELAGAVQMNNDVHDQWGEKYSRPYSPRPGRPRIESKDLDPRMILCQDCCPLPEEHH